MRSLAAVAVFLFVGFPHALPAAAGNADQHVTSLALASCAVTHIAREAEDGTPLKTSEWAPDTWRCKGAGGWFVFVTEGDLRPAVSFARTRSFDGDYHGFPKFGALGPKVEWRGKTVAGQFRPSAAIVRFDWANESGKGSVLGVVRLADDPAQTCVFAYVDASANKDANAIADRLADDTAATASCPVERPTFVGQVSAAWK